MRQTIHVDSLRDLRAAGASHVVEAADLVFVNSMALHPTERRRDDGAVTIADETRICLERMETQLQAAGSDLGHVVKMTCYLTDPDDQPEFREEYKTYWSHGDHPVRTTVYVGLVADCRVALDAIAVKSNSSAG